MTGPTVIRRNSSRIPVRRLETDWAVVEQARALWGGEPVLTQFLAGISLFFAPGEHFMIKAVREISKDIDDPRLQAEVDGFIRQEAQHATAHTKLNTRIAELAGIDDPLALCREVIAIWDAVERFGSPRLRAALTAAQEHAIASIAEVLGSDLELVGETDNEQIREIFLWHAIEECEHKSVAFDAYRAAGGTEFERMAVASVVLPLIVVAASLPMLRLLHAHGELGNVRSWAHFARVSTTKWLPKLGWRLAQWYRPGFHPTHLPTQAFELYWRAQLGADHLEVGA